MKCQFQIACDVKNPLVGVSGCSRIYGPQKGATEKETDKMDSAMEQFANLVEDTAWQDKKRIHPKGNRNTPGAGAAGGIGYAFMMFLNGMLRPGIDIVLDEIGLEEKITQADLVITGEGRLDAQTLMGKTPAGVASLAKKYHKRVLAIAGCFGDDVIQCKQSALFDDCLAVQDILSEQEQIHAMEKRNATAHLQKLVKQYFVNW